jgi:hypothetical protein
MAVVQLKFDQKGKYSYSTIANINQSQLIENHICVTKNGHSGCGENTHDPLCPQNIIHKKDLITRKNIKSRSLSTNGRPFINHNCTTSPCGGNNGKVCLCELEYREKRKRSESIKVDNWDFIYKEKSFGTNLDIPDDERRAIPK